MWPLGWLPARSEWEEHEEEQEERGGAGRPMPRRRHHLHRFFSGRLAQMRLTWSRWEMRGEEEEWREGVEVRGWGQLLEQ